MDILLCYDNFNTILKQSQNNIFNVKIIEKCNCYHIKEGYFMI